MASKIGVSLKKSLTLDAATAWFEAFDPTLKREILIIWLQRNQIFTQGIDADGSIIGVYSEGTEHMTQGRKKAGDPFDLFETGEFFQSMYIFVLKDEFIIDADSAKMEGQDWYRDRILGLTDENIIKLQERIKPKYISYARKVLGIN